MYRTPDPVKPTCPMCGMDNLTPPTEVSVTDGNRAFVKFGIKESPSDRFIMKTVTFDAKRGRVCLECGTIVMTLGAKDLATLRSQAAALTPMPE